MAPGLVHPASEARVARVKRPSDRPVVAAALAAACDGSSAAAMSSPPGGDRSVSGALVGVVVGAPIPAASVKVGDRSATADGNGRFAVSGVPAIGELPFIVAAQGSFRRRTSVEKLRYHAAATCSRPRGNLDPDTEPEGFALNATTEVGQPVVSCSDAQVGDDGAIR